MAYISRAQLMAQVEAQSAKIAALEASIRGHIRDFEELQFECRNYESMLAAYRSGEVRSDVLKIKDNASVIKVARALAEQGVPCFARGDHVYHSHTKAILASKGML